jgi:hypothetical protein
MAIVFAAIVPQFSIILKSWDSKAGAAETLQNGRVLIDHLNRNLSKAIRITAVSASSVTNGYIQFVANDSNTYRYDIGESKYVEFGPQPGTLSDLAGPVSSLQFTCYGGNDFTNTITDGNYIRFVDVETTLLNSAAMGQDKTFTASAYLRANSSNQTALTKGTTFDFDTTNGQDPALAKIDATRYLCAYSSGSGGYSNGYAVVLTVNPSTWATTAGTRCSLATPAAYGMEPALAQIDSTRYLCAYLNPYGYGYAVVLTVSDTTVTAGDSFAYTSGGAGNGAYPALAQIDAAHYLCAYLGPPYGYPCAVVLTVYDTNKVKKEGASLQIAAATGSCSSLAQIDATHYLCAYTGVSSRGYAVVLTVSDTTITAGTSLQFDGTNGQNPALAQIDSTHYLCAYTGVSSRGNAVVLTVSGTTVTAGTRYQFDGTRGLNPALVRIDSTHYLCAYTGPTSHGWAVVLKVNGSDWTISKETTLDYDTSATCPALAQIDTGNYLCAYQGPSSHGWSALLCTLKP